MMFEYEYKTKITKKLFDIYKKLEPNKIYGENETYETNWKPYLEYLNKNELLFAILIKHSGEYIGFSLFNYSINENYNTYKIPKMLQNKFVYPCVRLKKIIVKKEHRKNGLGSKLINLALKKFSKSRLMTLKVHKNNPAIKFYEKNDFKKMCETPIDNYFWMSK